MDGCLCIQKIDGLPESRSCKVWSMDRVHHELIVLEDEKEVMGMGHFNSDGYNSVNQDDSSFLTVGKSITSEEHKNKIDDDDRKIMYCFRYYKLPVGFYYVSTDLDCRLRNSSVNESSHIPIESSPVLPIFCSYAIVNNSYSIMNARLSLATDMLCVHSAHNLAAKQLLELGLVLEAIRVSCLFMRKDVSSSDVNNEDRQYHTSGTGAIDFFKASIIFATKMPSISERTRFFNHLSTFLVSETYQYCQKILLKNYFINVCDIKHKWEKDAVSPPFQREVNTHTYALLSTNNIAVGSDTAITSSNESIQKKTIYLSNTVEFPDELFGDIFALRKLFGYNYFYSKTKP